MKPAGSNLFPMKLRTLPLFTLLLFALFIMGGLPPFPVAAAEDKEFEHSDPFISLTANKDAVAPSDELLFQITYGNKGPQIAENVKVILNQPLDGRSPVQFVSADPEPDNWLESEFGRVPEFIIDKVETYETAEEGIIEVRVRVRESVAAQTLSATASLQAPKREAGKRLVVSNPIAVKITATTPSLSDAEAIKGEATQSGEPEETFPEKTQSLGTFPEPDTETNNLKAILLSSNAIWATLLFLGVSGLLILAFVAGRKSKAH